MRWMYGYVEVTLMYGIKVMNTVKEKWKIIVNAKILVKLAESLETSTDLFLFIIRKSSIRLRIHW